MFRWLRWIGCAVALLVAAPARADSLAEQVNRAIERGVAAARKSIGPDGAGTTHYHAAYPMGDTALLVYTLVKSGVRDDDPQVVRSLEWLRYQEHAKTYSTAVYALALDALGDRKLSPQIVGAAEWLEARQDPKCGRWAYPESATDLSNTQYAALALWAAERHGHRAKVETWAALLRGVAELERPGGGFGYHADHDQTGSMTVAALTALHLALERVPDTDARFRDERRTAKAAAARGWEYLETRFRVDRDLHGPRGTRYGWKYYFLYGIERLAALAGRDSIGGHDWYAAGARELVATQQEDGSWGDPWDTCFALLFLRRATFTSSGGTAKPVEGEGVRAAAAAPAFTQPGWDVRWIRRWLVLGPVADPKDHLFDDPPFQPGRAAPVPGQTAAGTRWHEVATRTNHVAPTDPDPRDRSMSWAFTYLHVSAETDAVLWFGNDDAIRIWLDGEPVFASHVHEADDWDRNQVKLHLPPGARRLMIQLENWSGPTHFWMRLARADGSGCTEVRPSLRADASDLAASCAAQPDLFSREEQLRLLPRSRSQSVTFDVEEQYLDVPSEGDAGAYPQWRGDPGDAKARGPNPGAYGVVGLHGDHGRNVMRLLWKVRVPDGPSKVRVRASATIVAPGRADAVLRLRAFDGKETLLAGVVVGPDAKPDAANWKWVEASLAGYEGKDVLLIVEASQGGREHYYEDLWIDAMEVVPAR